MTTQDKFANNPNQAAGQWIRSDKRLAIYLRDRFRCQLCHRKLYTDDVSLRDITLDHYVGRAQGGSNSERNLYTACASCNNKRQLDGLSKMQDGFVRSAMRVDLAPFRAKAKELLEDAQGDNEQAFRAAQRYVARLAATR